MRITVFLATLVVVASCGSFVSSKAYALGEPDYHTIGVRSLRGDDLLTEERIGKTPILAESASARLNSEGKILSENVLGDVQQIKELQETAAHGNGAVHPNAPTLEEKGKAVMAAGNGENKLAENVPVLDGEKATDTAAAAENPSRWHKMWHSVKSKFKSDKAAEATSKEVEHGLPETELTKMWDSLSTDEKKMMKENNIDIKPLSEGHPETLAKVFSLAVNGAASQKSTFVKVLQWTLAALGTAAVLYILFHWITGSAKPATSSAMTAGGA